LGAIDTHLAADEAAVVARMVPFRTVIASDVADALTRLLLRGGMPAEPALAVVLLVLRLLGGRTSEAARGLWLALLLFLVGAWLTLTIRGAARAALPTSVNISKTDSTTTIMRLKGNPLLISLWGPDRPASTVLPHDRYEDNWILPGVK
jgi:hypothetical protein